MLLRPPPGDVQAGSEDIFQSVRRDDEPRPEALDPVGQVPVLPPVGGQRAFEIARDKDCAILQLMMDRRRTDAQVFYESLGFVSSHQGMRLSLSQTD